jgi:hypothetical protein
VEPRISLVTLGVVDLSRAAAFYEALGWRASPASAEGVVFFQANGLALAIYHRAALAADTGVPACENVSFHPKADIRVAAPNFVRLHRVYC